MRQSLFAQAQIKVEKIADGKVWLEIAVRTQPRISEVRYNGMKKGERDDIQKMLQLMKGSNINQNIINRAIVIVKKYYGDKGFGNADVTINLEDDLSAKNQVIVNINVDKHDKVKVHKIYIDGNEVMSDGALQRVMKKPTKKASYATYSVKENLLKTTTAMTWSGLLTNITRKAIAMPKYLPIALYPMMKRVSMYTSTSRKVKNTISAESIGWEIQYTRPTVCKPFLELNLVKFTTRNFLTSVLTLTKMP